MDITNENDEERQMITLNSIEDEDKDKDKDKQLKCSLCSELFVSPKLLSCFHTFCFKCIEQKLIDNSNSIECPSCSSQSNINDLVDNYLLINQIEEYLLENKSLFCGSCSSNHIALAHCNKCLSYLCSKCSQAHQFMKCFEQHLLRFLSKDCHSNFNSIDLDLNIQINQIDLMKEESVLNVDNQLRSLEDCYYLIEKQIDQSFIEYQQILNEIHNDYLSQLKCEQRQEEMNLIDKLEIIQKGSQAFEENQILFKRYQEKCSLDQFNQLKKKLFTKKLNKFEQLFSIDQNEQNNFIQFIPTPIQHFKLIIQNHSGKLIKSQSKQSLNPNIQKDSLLTSSNGDNDCKCSGIILSSMSSSNGHSKSNENDLSSISSNDQYKSNENENDLSEGEVVAQNVRALQSIFDHSSSNIQKNFEDIFQINEQFNSNQYSILTHQSSSSPIEEISPSNEYPPPAFLSQYSSRSSNGGNLSRSPTPYSNLIENDCNSQLPLRRTIQSMQVRSKFGSLGPQKSQFNAPHGFCLGIDEEIIVADTNNHRIQIFDKKGLYKCQFGIPGREEGQLWYPRKVAVIRQTGIFVICDRGNERSRMQIFSPNGDFIQKISIRYIDILAGLAITQQGNIVAVDSVSPTVFCISQSGDLIKWFDCSDYMREPSDIALYNNQYFVCDFKGHCVVVFDEDGTFLRRIGSQILTNFPNGIDISDAGDVIIGDSHGNRFHIAVFTRTGEFLQEYDCPYVKVSRCCGLKITSDGFIVTLAKNNHHVLVLNTLYLT